MSRFRRRLMGLAQLKEAKRKDFVRVEYIENTSNAYIDTKLFTVYNDGRTYKHIVNLSYTVTNERQLNGANGNGYFGINENGNFECAYIQDSAIAVGDSWYNINFSYVSPTNTSLNIKYEIDNQLLERNLTKTTLYNYPYAIYIFAIGGRNDTAPSFFCKERIKSYQIYIDDVLVRDYIPMYQISTDTYGLWDRVEEKFYTSPNGTAFTGGARVVEDANGKLYYIKNYISFAGGGKSLVSIGLKPNETDYYETKWYFAGSSRSNFMGARTKNNNNDYQCYGYSKVIHIVYNTGALVNYSVTYTNKAYIFKTYFNKKTNQMYGAIYDANKRILAQNKVAKRSGAASVDFFIGKQNGLNNYYPPVNSRMYYFKYWRNHTLVRDMIPVQSVETGEYGFFDKVNLKIYYSSGSADFTGA